MDAYRRIWAFKSPYFVTFHCFIGYNRKLHGECYIDDLCLWFFGWAGDSCRILGGSTDGLQI